MVETKSQMKKKDSIKKKKKKVKNEIQALAKKKNNERSERKMKVEGKKNAKEEKNTEKNSNKNTPNKKLAKKKQDTTTVSTPSSSKSKRSRNKISNDNSASKEKKSPSTPKIVDKKKTPNKKEIFHAKSLPSKNNNPLLNVRVHRMRHLNFQPRGILCMAPTPPHANCSDYVAVSREGGTIELKSPDEKWRTVSTIAGLSGKTVNVMAWVRNENTTTKQTTSSSISYYSDFHKSHTEIHNQNTCIGASKDGTIFVLDFAKAEFTSVIGSGGGGVFALVSLDDDSKNKNETNGLVAAGCEDGSIRIYKVTKDEEKTSLILISTLPSAGSSILSLAWCREYDGIGTNGTVIYAGVADGTIRRYECKSKTKGKAHNVNESSMLATKSTWRSNIRMTVESLDRTTPTFVWALRVLNDGTVISGDSLGHVQFWDGKTGTLLQSFEQNDKKADVLTIAVTSDERQVFASGIDTRLIAIERPSYEDRNGPSEWILANAQRPHTHDVKALCVCRVGGSATKPQEILCSGGVDTKICTFVVTGLKFNRPTTRFPWPTCSPISVARDGRVLLLRRAKSLELHRIVKDDEPKNSTTKKTKIPLNRILEENKTHIGTFDIRGKYNTICSDISPDGKYIIVSTATDVLLFEVTYVEVEYDNTLRCEPKQIDIDDDFKTHSVVAVKFLSDSKGIICVDKHGNIRILRIQNSEDDIGTTEVTSTDVPYHHTARNINTSFPIHSIAVSKNDKMFATVRSGLGSGIVSLFVRNEEDDTITSYWTLPALESSVTCVSFLSSGNIAVTCCNYATYVFDVKGRKLSDWSETIGFPATMPSELKKSFDFPSTIVAHPKDPDKFIIGSFGSFCVVSTSLEMPERCRTVPEKHVRKKRKKVPEKQHMKNSMTTNPNFTMCMRYNSIIHTDFVSENEMIVVEQPWLNVLASLPEIMERRIFGT